MFSFSKGGNFRSDKTDIIEEQRQHIGAVSGLERPLKYQRGNRQLNEQFAVDILSPTMIPTVKWRKAMIRAETL